MRDHWQPAVNRLRSALAVETGPVDRGYGNGARAKVTARVDPRPDRAYRIDHGRCTIRVGSVVDDDRGAGLHDAPGNPGDDATGRPGHHARLVRRATGSAASVTAAAGSGRWRPGAAATSRRRG